MKLKPIIASMMLLGLAAPAFADDNQSQLDSMKASIAKMETIIGQNQNANISQPQDWFNRITISGLVNVDAYVANRPSVFKATTFSATVPFVTTNVNPSSSGGSNNIALQNANIFAHAVVNDWVTADIDFVYQDNNHNFVARPNNSTALDEAYVTIGNFARTPVYFRAGRIYEAFGMYERYPLLTQPTQLLSETSATTAQLGFVVPMGFYGSIAGFRGLPQSANNAGFVVKNSQASGVTANGIEFGNRTQVQNGVANLGYMYATDNFGAKLDVGYIYNMADVNYIAATLPIQTKAFGGVSASADVRYNAFDAGLRWVGAVRNTPDIISTNGGNAKPQAGGVDIGYTFPVMAHSSRIGAGYQYTRQAVLAGGSSSFNVNGLPKNRWYADYMVNISKWTDLGFAVYQDKDYGTSDGCTPEATSCAGTGNTSTVGVLRLSVKVA